MIHPVVTVSKKGKDALTSTNPNDFIFHSDYNTFKIIVEATKSVTLAASTNNQTFTEPHGQKFIPLPDAFAKENSRSQVFKPNSVNPILYGVKTGWSSSGIRFNYIAANATDLVFNFDNSLGSTVAITIRYFVLEKIK